MFAQTCRRNLVSLATAYAKARKITLAAVSKQFYGNGSFLPRFKAGEGSVSIDKYGEIVEALVANWPEGADWPYPSPVVIKAPKGKRVGKSSR